MITEKELSKTIGREIKSPIRIASVLELDLNQEEFLSFFKPHFEALSDDLYIIKGNQIEYLKSIFLEEMNDIESVHKDFFHGKKDLTALDVWIRKLNDAQKEKFERLSEITRQRSISTFNLLFNGSEIEIDRVFEDSFAQDVSDFRTWTRVFEQTKKEVVENDFFYNFLKAIGKLVKEIHPEVRAVKITSHFMRTIAQEKIKGENSPEGVHEDGSQYIVSALVINRENVTGGESQIYELIDGHKEMIYGKELDPGEFIFQADTGEEKTFGNDLWHYVTPIEVVDNQHQGLRDIIGFDIDIVS